MKIYTRTGDDGTTFMPGEGRVKKYDCSIDAQGEIDELMACIALVNQHYPNELLPRIINRLMHVGAQLALGKKHPHPVQQAHIDELEKTIDDFDLPALQNFILPCYPAEVHLARTVCRRAERNIAAWRDQYTDIPGYGREKFDLVIPYINRLSDYLFALARHICREHERKEIIWKAEND